MTDYRSFDDMDLVSMVKSYSMKSAEFHSAKNEIFRRYFEEIRKAVHIFCMPSPEDEKVAREVFEDLEKILLDYKKGVPLRVFLASYARKKIALPRWRQNPGFYRAAYSAGAVSVIIVIMAVVLRAGLFLPDKGRNTVRINSIYSGENNPIIHLDHDTCLYLGKDAVIEAVSVQSNGKMTANIKLEAGSLECRVRKLVSGEYFRIGNNAGIAEVLGTDFRVSYIKGIFRIDVLKGRVLFNDKINGTNIIIMPSGHYETESGGPGPDVNK